MIGRTLLFVVDRSRPEIYSQLEQAFAGRAAVIFDRRVGDRRRTPAPGAVASDRRGSDRRRHPPVTWPALGFMGTSVEQQAAY